MAKRPVLSREIFYERLPRGGFRMLDFALVNTTLGAMIEPRPVLFNGGKTTNADVDDYGFDRISELDKDQSVRLYGFALTQRPTAFNV